MANQYPIKFSTQLRQHLRALRKTRGLTQAQLGELIGVSQARIAEIEANPGLVSFEQLMQLFAVLEVSVSLNEELKEVPQEETNAKNKLKIDNIEKNQNWTLQSKEVEKIESTIGSNSYENMRKKVENSPTEQMRRQLENSPMEQARRQYENSPMEQMLKNISKPKTGSW